MMNDCSLRPSVERTICQCIWITCTQKCTSSAGVVKHKRGHICICHGLVKAGWILSEYVFYLSMSTDSPFSPFLLILETYQTKLCNQASKKCIAINWKVGYPPTMSQRMAEMSSYVSLDLIYYKIRGILGNFHKVWMPYMEYSMIKLVSIENMPTSEEISS